MGILQSVLEEFGENMFAYNYLERKTDEVPDADTDNGKEFMAATIITSAVPGIGRKDDTEPAEVGAHIPKTKTNPDANATPAKTTSWLDSLLEIIHMDNASIAKRKEAKKAARKAKKEKARKAREKAQAEKDAQEAYAIQKPSFVSRWLNSQDKGSNREEVYALYTKPNMDKTERNKSGIVEQKPNDENTIQDSIHNRIRKNSGVDSSPVEDEYGPPPPIIAKIDGIKEIEEKIPVDEQNYALLPSNALLDEDGYARPEILQKTEGDSRTDSTRQMEQIGTAQSFDPVKSVNLEISQMMGNNGHKKRGGFEFNPQSVLLSNRSTKQSRQSNKIVNQPQSIISISSGPSNTTAKSVKPPVGEKPNIGKKPNVAA